MDPSSFTQYPHAIYLAKHLHNTLPPITTNLLELESAAQLVLPAQNFWYGAGGCSTGSTITANRTAFTKYRIIPSHLSSTAEPFTSRPNTTRSIHGSELPYPITMAPIGAQSIYHPTAEAAVAKVFGEEKLPFTLSTVADTPIAAAAAANGAGNPRWFQLYYPQDEELMVSMVTSAKENGYTALVITVDTWSYAWRPQDLDYAYIPFLQGNGTGLVLGEPHCRRMFGEVEALGKEERQKAVLYHLSQFSAGSSVTRVQVEKVRKVWGEGPIILKGIQSVRDAKMAVEWGVDGIIVSNHGGRQVDGAIGSLEALPGIVEAVGDSLTIGFDSGIRCGADIVKALALGADYVQIGRPMIWGLALGGEEGVRHVLKSFLTDFRLHVGLTGCRELGDLGKDLLSKEGGPA